ncbi:MAG: heme ABC transporter ATP-binding protein [Anaerolineales bacterium]|nr:heme ABC transporter ATP-binding protein [Anaerolineales bacterium]
MLEIQALYASYHTRPVIQDISLTVTAGEIVAVIGPNGAGKSTLIRAISGVISHHASRMQVAGRDLSSLAPYRRARYISVVPQARQIPPAFTVYQTVLLGRTPYLGWLGKPSQIDHDKVALALERTQVQELAERRVGELSGGEQQRVLLARALAQDTPVMLLDEPTTHLDLQHQATLLNLLRQLASQDHLAVLMVLHDLNLAGIYADRLALLVQGRLAAEGRPEQVLTSENLQKVYRLPVQVVAHPTYGTPLVLPGIPETPPDRPPSP